MLLQTAHCPPTLGKPWRRGLAYRRKAGRWCPEQLGRPTPLATDMDMCLLLALACFCVRSQVTYRCCLACRRNLVRWALLFEAAGTDGPYHTPISPRHPNRQLPTEALVAALETGHTKAICHGVAATPRYCRLASTTSTARSLLQRKHCRPILGRPWRRGLACRRRAGRCKRPMHRTTVPRSRKACTEKATCDDPRCPTVKTRI